MDFACRSGFRHAFTHFKISRDVARRVETVGGGRTGRPTRLPHINIMRLPWGKWQILRMRHSCVYLTDTRVRVPSFDRSLFTRRNCLTLKLAGWMAGWLTPCTAPLVRSSPYLGSVLIRNTIIFRKERKHTAHIWLVIGVQRYSQAAVVCFFFVCVHVDFRVRFCPLLCYFFLPGHSRYQIRGYQHYLVSIIIGTKYFWSGLVRGVGLAKPELGV